MPDRASQEKAVSAIAASDIVETIPSALIILDRNLNITSANRAFYQTFRTSRSETEGCLIYDLGNRSGISTPIVPNLSAFWSTS